MIKPVQVEFQIIVFFFFENQMVNRAFARIVYPQIIAYIIQENSQIGLNVFQII